MIYINDLPTCVKSKIRLFADDSYIYRTINSVADAKDLQYDIEQLTNWEKSWSMEFNPDKCQVLRVTNKRKIISFDYQMHSQKL